MKMRKSMVEKTHPQLSVRNQCELLGVNRNRLNTSPRGKPSQTEPSDLKLMRRIDEVYLRFPEFGVRRMVAIYRKPRTSVSEPGAKKYPYLLEKRVVERADEVWCADITYIPMRKGFAYLVAVMDWKTRAVLSWKVSNTMEVGFCLEAFEEALRVAGKSPEIFNTDQGSQFTSQGWIEALEGAGIRVSMDGKGRWMDNVFIERLWRSVKYEGVYLWGPATVQELEKQLEVWFEDYNRWKPHSALGGLTPWESYRPQSEKPWEKTAA